jgi:molybdopterin-synthase adenylyltransferase
MDARERVRYSRQVLFHGIGEQGQEALLRGHAAILGCGALGSFHAAALARAGAGRITIVDRDYVEPSNLQRQWLFEESDAAAGLPKAAAAERALRRINSGVEVRGIVADVTASNIDDLLGGAAVVLDGTDNFGARFLLNDYAVSRGVPWIYGAAVGSYGLTMPVLPGRTACLRCVYPEPPSGAQPTCDTAGVLGSIVAAVAALQVADAIKILCGRGQEVRARITTLDVWEGGIREVSMPAPDPACPACALGEFPWLDRIEREPLTLCGRDAIQVHDRPRTVDLGELQARLEALGEVRANPFALRFRAGSLEMTVFPDGRAIVKGTSDPAVARGFYAKYLG